MIRSRLLRTSSFRLTLLYAGLFGASVLLLFGVMLWSMTGYMASQLDETVANEIAEVESDARGGGTRALVQIVDGLVSHGQAGVYYQVQDHSGHVIAGNLSTPVQATGVQELPIAASPARALGINPRIRGRGVRSMDGDLLFVGVDRFELEEMREMVIRAFLWMGGATVLLAVSGGMIMSAGLLRRVESISRDSQAIVSGDLDRRISIRGTDDEFDHLAHSLNVMLDRIQGLMQAMSEVSSDIAHDLRTPLTRLRHRLELAASGGLSGQALQATLDGSLRDVDTILATFGALLRIAQIEGRVQMAAFTPVDVSGVLVMLADIYQPEAEGRSHHLTACVEPDLLVRGDRDLLTQLFVNLIENAIQHCPDGTSITIGAQASLGKVVVTVRDNGSGIPPEARTKVLQRLYRLERSRSTTGTGLGLSLAAAIAALHGASLDLADNAPGLSVTLTFPDSALTPLPSVSTSRA